MIPLKSAAEIKKIKKAGGIVWQTLSLLKKKIKTGVTTAQLDAAAADFIRQSGGRAAFKGYNGFPAHICTSLNEEVVHGIPGGRVIRGGDIVSVDVGVEVDGYFADAAISVAVRGADDQTKRLVDVTRQALSAGIAQARAGNYLEDISNAVQHCVETAGFSVVREFVGHGIGTALHEPPQIPNFGTPGKGERLLAGMVLAIEPMVNAGGWKIDVLADGWTAVSRDRSRSAHFEHTICVTAAGPEILTQVPS